MLSFLKRLVGLNKMLYPPYPAEIKFTLSGPTYGNPYFCLVDEEGTNLVYTPYTCKEYLLDYVYMTRNPTQGCTYAANNGKKACLTELRVMVGGFNEFLEPAIDLVNQVEKDLNIENSLIFSIPNNTSSVVFRGSPKWMVAPPMLSLFSLLVRAGRVHKKDTPYKETFSKFLAWDGKGTPPPDIAIWKGAKPAIDAIMEKGYKEIFGEDPAKNWPLCGDIHSRGINMMGTGYYKKAMPHWYNHITVPSSAYMLQA